MPSDSRKEFCTGVEEDWWPIDVAADSEREFNSPRIR